MLERLHPRHADRPLTIFFSAGEPSGDMHAANLIRQLRERQPDVRAVGYGGPEMASAGCDLHTDLTALAVMWFLRVLLNLHKFWGLVSRADRYFRHEKPDAVVLIDYPGFNWWIARRAKRHGIPVFYFAPPQIWAWARWRVKKMRALVDHVLCCLPFEAAWFRERGCNATFVGHPYFDEVRRHRLDQEFIAEQRQRGRLVTLLPGSRTQEVHHNLKYFLRAAQRIHKLLPDVRFAVAAFKPRQAEYARGLCRELDLPIEVHLRRTPELIHAAECCLAVSGSVSLELLYYMRPTVILYWVTPLAYWLQGVFRKVKYITLVNLLATDDAFSTDVTPFDPDQPGAEKVLFPEYVTSEDKSEQLAAHVVEWLIDEPKRRERIAALAELKQRIAHGGATQQAADYILRTLPQKRTTPRPHFIDTVRASEGVRQE